MKIFKSLGEIPDSAKNAVIAIGNFDGVHCGHQALIKKAKEVAKENNLQVGVLTFEPHPRALFQPSQPPARLTPANLKAQRLQKENIDILVSLDFDWDFASQSAEVFIQNILKDGLNAAHIIVGHDFHFGQMRKGTAETIKDAGLNIDIVAPVKDSQDRIISSSRIREYLKTSEIDKANDMLGWEWEIQGEIVQGDQRGRELGYPTANVMLRDTLHPAYGVYACYVQIEGEKEWLKAATNIGIRPMFEVAEGQVEAHILDFPFREIYGKTLRIKPVARIRSEAKFNSLDELIEQMGKDCAKAKNIL
ncbi:MAG: bifunctional riboflavin kinase/FAD synthetase [Pseudomonadota bacterium]